jgi:ABC-type Co2+ transport system permease subunit
MHMAGRIPAVLGRRVCAVLAAVSALLHLTMLGHASSAVLAVLIAAMALTCLFCGYELWRAGSPRIWCLVGVMSLAMVAAHLSLPGHQHAEQPAAPGPPAEPMSMLMGLATTVSLVEAVIAAAVLWVLTRRRAAGLV